MTEPTKYHRYDLLRSIEDMHPNCYPSQVGSLKGVLSSVLIHVEVHDPKMFQEIMQFEMRCQERMKALGELAEADVEAGLI